LASGNEFITLDIAGLSPIETSALFLNFVYGPIRLPKPAEYIHKVNHGEYFRESLRYNLRKDSLNNEY